MPHVPRRYQRDRLGSRRGAVECPGCDGATMAYVEQSPRPPRRCYGHHACSCLSFTTRYTTMAIFAAMTTVLAGLNFFMSSHTSSGTNDAVIMTEKYLAQRFCRNRPVPSISNRPLLLALPSLMRP